MKGVLHHQQLTELFYQRNEVTDEEDQISSTAGPRFCSRQFNGLWNLQHPGCIALHRPLKSAGRRRGNSASHPSSAHNNKYKYKERISILTYLSNFAAWEAKRRAKTLRVWHLDVPAGLMTSQLVNEEEAAGDVWRVLISESRNWFWQILQRNIWDSPEGHK